jgi:hypothetical protein
MGIALDRPRGAIAPPIRGKRRIAIMKSASLILGLVLGGPAFAHGQLEARAASVVITGEVLRYEPGKLLVVRAADGREITYSLTPALVMPTEVQVGRSVSVQTEQDRDGVANVTRVTTTSLTPEGNMKRTTEETRVSPSGQVRQKTTTTVTGDVVSYAPGRSIVVRNATGETVTYELGPSVVVPPEIQVGKRVTLHTEPGRYGSTTVSRVTTTSITPEGQVKNTVEETRREPSGDTTKTTTVTVQGKVQAYVPGKTITVIRPDGTNVTYVIGEGAKLPAEIPVGKAVTIRTLPSGSVETIIIDQD